MKYGRRRLGLPRRPLVSSGAMRHARLGRTGLPVSRLCLGTRTFGLQCDEATSHAILDRAAAGGITFLDTADVYPLGGTPETIGLTEEIVGRWLRGRRRDVVVATKCSGATGRRPWDRGTSRKHVLDALLAAIAAAALLSCPVGADERCDVQPFRNALAPGGTQATMQVVNDGGACRIVNYIDARVRMQPDAIRTTARPQYGTVNISQPGTIYYRPSPGFIGSDEFAYAGTGRTRDGRLVEMNVRITVTVLPPPALQADKTP